MLVAFGPANSVKINPSEKSRLKPSPFTPSTEKPKEISEEKRLRRVLGKFIKDKNRLNDAVKRSLKLNQKS